MNVIDGVVRYAHDAHEVSINTVNAAIKETREDLKKLIDLVTAIAQPGRSSTIPIIAGELNPEDYETNFWFKGSLATRRADKGAKSGSPIINCFLEDQKGVSVSEAVKDRLRGDLAGHWWEMFFAGRNPDVWGRTGLNEKDIFREKFEAKYPFLRLCEAGWKSEALWSNYFSSWRQWLEEHLAELEKKKGGPVDLADLKAAIALKASADPNDLLSPTPAPDDKQLSSSPMPARDPEEPPAPMSPIPIQSDTGATTGSKHGRDEDEPPTASDPKRQKGKGRAIELITPTQFRNPSARAALQTYATMTKVRFLFSFVIHTLTEST